VSIVRIGSASPQFLPHSRAAGKGLFVKTIQVPQTLDNLLLVVENARWLSGSGTAFDLQNAN